MALRLRSLLRAAGRLPHDDFVTLRDTMRTVARAPRGDDVLPARHVRSLQDAYQRMQTEGRLAFLNILSKQDVDEEAVRDAAAAVVSAERSRMGAALRARSDLREALRPASERILERIAQQSDGLRFLVSLRTDLLAGMRGSAAPSGSPPASAPLLADDGERERWRSVDASLRRLLSTWFDSGLLHLERLKWDETPPALLEKVMRYERVHPFTNGWADVRTRLTGPGKRIFALTHPRMQGEPLVFVHVALLPHLPTRLADILPETLGGGAPDTAGPAGAGGTAGAADVAEPERRVAVFYSISSPFTGLRGVPIGGLLIKKVQAQLAREEAQLSTFVTLSPVPGFGSWLEARLARLRADPHALDPAEAGVLDALLGAAAASGVDSLAPFGEAAALEGGEMRGALESLCARYLCLAKHRQRALDSVAAFHLRNGASLVKLHWGANASARGLRESAGIMVSYEYVPGEIEARHSAYVTSGEISAAPEVWSLI